MKIKPAAPPRGKKWEQVSRREKGRLSRRDIDAATKALADANGGRLPSNMSRQKSGGRFTGRILVDGVPHTWHHNNKKREMQLVPTELREEVIAIVGPHIGHALC